MAKQAEEKADRRKAQIRIRVESDLSIKFGAQPKFWEGRDYSQEVQYATSKSASADPVWKTHVAMNQWYISQATMYGTAATTDLLEQLIKMLESRA